MDGNSCTVHSMLLAATRKVTTFTSVAAPQEQCCHHVGVHQ